MPVFWNPVFCRWVSAVFEPKRIVIATGSRPIVPEAWRTFGERILTTDEIFELEDLPRSLAVVGLGVIGLELGQAFNRLGVQVTGIDQLQTIGQLDDPEINCAALRLLAKEMPLWLGHPAAIEEADDGQLRVTAGEQSVVVEKSAGLHWPPSQPGQA